MTKIESPRRRVLRTSDGGFRKLSSGRCSNVIFRCISKITRARETGFGRWSTDLRSVIFLIELASWALAAGLLCCEVVN